MIKLQFITPELDELFKKHKRLWVGYSGGVDSTVLLQVMQKHYGARVFAIHVNHGLNKNADFWQEHCIKYCKSLGVSLSVEKIKLTQKNNIEAQARALRYGVFETYVNSDDCLILAHHADDQIETMLMRFFRGSGLLGMSAMRNVSFHHDMTIIRPFLTLPKSEIELYAKTHELAFIEDDSNFSFDFLRNKLRHGVLPLLENIWPSLKQNLLARADYFYDSMMNLEALAELDAVTHLKNTKLPLSIFKDLPIARQRNLLYFWLNNLKVQLRSKSILEEILNLIFIKQDAQAKVCWSQYCILRYDDCLYFYEAKDLQENIKSKFIWDDFPQSLAINDKFLIANQSDFGLKVEEETILTVKFRQGGEKIKIKGQNKSLKKMMQEWRIPPWERARIPLLYVGELLVCVVGYAYADEFYKDKGYSIKLATNK